MMSTHLYFHKHVLNDIKYLFFKREKKKLKHFKHTYLFKQNETKDKIIWRFNKSKDEWSNNGSRGMLTLILFLKGTFDSLLLNKIKEGFRNVYKTLYM